MWYAGIDWADEHHEVVVLNEQGQWVASCRVTRTPTGLAVYPVNPKTVDRRRKPSGAKTDAIDAYLLAKTARSDLTDLRKSHSTAVRTLAAVYLQ